MKALFITTDKDDQYLINNILYSRFSKSTVTYCQDLEVALEHLNYNGPYAIYIIDTDNKNLDPNNAFNQLSELAGVRPTIFVGRPNLIKSRITDETLNAHESNATLVRPIDVERLTSLIKEAISWLNQEDFEEGLLEVNPYNYIPIKIKNFYFFRRIEQNAYLEVTETKYMKILIKNKEYHPSLIDRFVARGVRKLYLEKSEVTQFLEDSVNKLSCLLIQEHLKFKKSVYIQIQSLYIVHQYLKILGVREPLLDLVKLILAKTSQNYMKIQNFVKILNSFPFSQNDLYEQSILTNYLCETILMKIGWESDLSRYKLGLASVLHDYDLPHEEMRFITTLTDANLLDYTEEERRKFADHPLQASGISQQFSGFTESDFIITQHHEIPDGTGFPYGVNAHKLTKLSCIFILSNNFIIETSKHKYSKKVIKETLSNFKQYYNIGNFKEPLSILTKLFAKL